MEKFSSLIIKEAVFGLILGVVIDGWMSGFQFFQCLIGVFVIGSAISRIFLQFIGELSNDNKCGLKSTISLTFMNVTNFLLSFFIFACDFVLAFQNKYPPVVVGTDKAYFLQTLFIYFRYYYGYFNLELSFPFIAIMIEAIASASAYVYLHEYNPYVVPAVTILFQIIVFQLIFPKQSKEIDCLHKFYNDEFNKKLEESRAQAKDKAKTPSDKKKD
ncbi:hypothetical protein TRFO_22771 [Tritrichomonas foetus]|uniref:Uncharacterized protein n=1 Tax=Tritrichomonas foetus TaxID=1144522 RepID=A0A1J4KB00_9EUKA|nr:hypothetical protein TRFO_22771 [Tritrichomonas foetus]|eukprot:OHT08593.1 hypothetical protein TRFO_22771 [Tritrichomonas foetus]